LKFLQSYTILLKYTSSFANYLLRGAGMSLLQPVLEQVKINMHGMKKIRNIAFLNARIEY